MRTLKRRIRGLFALQAVILLFAAARVAADQTYADKGVSPLRHFGLLAVFAVLGLIFAMAWGTTRKSSTVRNPWAIAASLMSIALGGLIVWLEWHVYSNLSYTIPGLIVLALGAGGLYFYGQGAATSDSPSATSPTTAPTPAKRGPVAGDRTSAWVNHLVTALSLVLEFAAIYLWSFWAHSHGLLRGHIPGYVLFTIAILLTTVLHECGHALVASSFRMRLLTFNAGPVRWRKYEGKWKFKFDPEGLFNLGGAVRVVPTNPEQPRAQDLWMIAAGPLANIFLGSLFLAAVLCVHWPFYDQTWRLVAFTASFSFIAAVTNLLPFMTEDGGYSDGAQILQILTQSPLYDYRRTMNSLAAMLVTARRYKNLDIDAIERAASQFPREFKGLNLHLCASNYYWDSDRIRDARYSLAAAEAIQTNYSIDLPAPLHTPFIIGHAYLNHNAVAARNWWDRMEAKKPERLNVDYWLAKSALLWIEGRQKEAEEAWQKADVEAQKLPQFGAYEFDRSRCALLRLELDRPSPDGVTRTFSRVPQRSPRAAAAVVSASSPAVAAAASDAAVEAPRFDPLQFIRTQAAMEKLRG
jgi:Zn-dependent protease